MLEVTINPPEFWDEKNECFVYIKPVTLRLEHSLLSISKWEAKWKKPWLDQNEPKTYQQSVDYIKCMTINKDVPDIVYTYIDPKTMDFINKYIEDNHTATWFSNSSETKTGRAKKSQVVTSELIYFWMSQYNLPFDICEKWHLGRLLTLIDVCNRESQPSKKMSKEEINRQNHALNMARRAKHRSRG